jgi:type III restriction enzyme
MERNDAIYLVEVKAANQVDTGEVQDKKRAAMNYCKYASEYSVANGKKP